METLRAGGREGGGRSCARWDAQSFAESEPVRSAAHVCCVSMGHVFSALLPRLSALCLQVSAVAAGASNKPGSHVASKSMALCFEPDLERSPEPSL